MRAGAPLDGSSEPAASLASDGAPGRARGPSRRNRVSDRQRSGPPNEGFAAMHGWDRAYEVYADFDLPPYVGASTYSKLPWVR